MIISNAKVKGEIVNIVIENGKIAEITNKPLVGDIDAAGRRVVPGMIDIHAHGCMGLDTMDADFAPMCEYLGGKGTTSWLPTTMTMDYESLKRVDEAKTDFPGTNILGFHFEGPYISHKQKGAQNEAYIKDPDLEGFKQFKNVKMITMAPELPGSMEFIEKCGCVVAIGHTSCDYATAIDAIEHGANCLTHTYNAMPGLHHRNPGPIGAAFEKQIYAQLICDGFHISKPMVLATYKLFGSDRMVIISDAIRPAGLADGVYESGGLEVYMKDGAARLADGTIAGSTATLWQCVCKAVEFGIDFDEAVKMATETPAKLIGADEKGRIETGCDADLLIISDNMEIDNVIIGGEVFR